VQEIVPQNILFKILYFILSCVIKAAVDWTTSVYHGVFSYVKASFNLLQSLDVSIAQGYTEA
jgi:hypothetical protein